MFLIGICIVDACLAYKLAMRTEETRAEIYPALAEEIRDNTYDQPNKVQATIPQTNHYSIIQVVWQDQVYMHTSHLQKRGESYEVDKQ